MIEPNARSSALRQRDRYELGSPKESARRHHGLVLSGLFIASRLARGVAVAMVRAKRERTKGEGALLWCAGSGGQTHHAERKILTRRLKML